MHQDSFRSVVCRSLSKSVPSRSKDETVQCVVPCVVTLQPSVCQGCQGRERSWSQSYREERSMPSQRDYLMPPSLSKHFAEDLLRGAMDIQESVAMLERFQAASQSMRQSNMKRRPETGEKSPDIDTIIREVLLRPSSVKKVSPKTVTNGNGLHGKLSNSTGELKNLVKKDGLHKKNVLSMSSNNEQVSFSQPTWDLPNEHLVSKTTQQKKVVPRSLPSCAPVQTGNSTTSLVARLMGLDGLPSENDHSMVKDEKIKPVSSPRAVFDIEMPKSKRLLPQLSGADSQFCTEMCVSDKLHYNAGVNYTRSQKVVGPLYHTPVTNKIRLMKSIEREKNMEPARAKSIKDMKIVSPTSRNRQTEEATEISRRTREKQKSHVTERSREGRKDVKAKASSASRAKMLQKSDKKLAASSSSGSTKSILQKAPSNSRQRTRTRRNVKSSTADEIVAYQVRREINNVPDESDGPSTEHSATPSDESLHNADWDAESSVDDGRNDFSESNESFISTSCRGESISSADEYRQSTAVIPIKEAVIKDEISLLLLSDQSFLSRAAEMTGIGVLDHLKGNQYKGTVKPETRNRELYLDTAAEQLEWKRDQRNRLCYTGFQGEKLRATAYLSLEALLLDISNGIRKLSSYAAADACGTADSMNMKLERDLMRCTDTCSINGVWDMGWEDWLCMEETECFVRDAGEDILSLLIEEAALDVLT